MQNERGRAGFPFLLLAALFTAALVVCNLIANKFVAIDLGFKEFELSAGILPYPLTFLITDLLSEIYGRRRANQVVLAGFAASLFVLGVLVLGGEVNAIPDSLVGNEAYNQVFSSAPRVIAASMTAYLVAQFVDIRVFHFWKKLTRGKHLWIRNNFSTVFSQLLDTILVITILFWGMDSESSIPSRIFDGWLFKVLCAAVDTPIFYLGVYFFRRHLPGEGESRTGWG